MDNPLVSIFMPVYNGQNFLHETIKNVQKQTYSNYELVCVDDSSTDDSFSILEEYAKQDSRIKVYKKDNGGNVPKSFNFVINKLKGDFFLYMSQDDKISENLLEKAIAAYKSTGCDVIVPTCIFVDDEDGIELSLSPNTVISGKEAFMLSLDWRIHGFNIVNMSLLKDERCDESIFNSDEFLTRRYFFKAKNVTSCDAHFYYYRGNHNSITKTPKAYRLQGLLNNQAISEFIKLHRKELPAEVEQIWNPMLAEKLYWAWKFIRTNLKNWDKDDQDYARTIYKKCKAQFKISQFLSLLRYPKVFVKMCIVYTLKS